MSTESSSTSNISSLISFLQFLLSAIHIFIKLRALPIQKYDVVIMEKSKLTMMLNEDVESADNVTNKNIISNDISMTDVVVDMERHEEELHTCRKSIEALRMSNRESMAKRDSFCTTPKNEITDIEYANKNIKVLQNQLSSLNAKPLEYIPLYEIRLRLQSLTDAVNRGEIFDESEFDHLLRCMDVNEEYIQEQKNKERLWREKISKYAQECLVEQRRFIPPDIFVSTLTQLMREKGIPAILAKRLMNKKCLWLIRMSESYICKLHYAELHGKYSVEGNNLDIVETLAIYASVPVKLPNDGNGKKALWRKSIEDTVKKLMANKENDTLSASLMRNPAYKNHVGLFTSDELYNPEMVTSVEEESMSRSASRSVSKPIDSFLLNKKDEVNNPILDLPFASALYDKSEVSDIMPIAIDEKINIKSQLQSMLINKSNSDRNM
jgi:hypothetical protein